MTATMDRIDWAHTDKAEHDRRIKAPALADAARRLGIRDGQLTLGSGNRRRVRLEADILSGVSEDTWFVVHELLAADDPAPAPTAPVCGLGAPIPADSHRGEVHLYPAGLPPRRCIHRSPPRQRPRRRPPDPTGRRREQPWLRRQSVASSRRP